MSCMSSSSKDSWFTEYFGFDESKLSYSQVQAEFYMDEERYLLCKKSKFPRQYVGPFSCPSISDLNEMVLERGGGGGGGGGGETGEEEVVGNSEGKGELSPNQAKAEQDLGGLSFVHEAHPVGVVRCPFFSLYLSNYLPIYLSISLSLSPAPPPSPSSLSLRCHCYLILTTMVQCFKLLRNSMRWRW